MIQTIQDTIECGDYSSAYTLLENYLAAGAAYTDTTAILEASIYNGLQDSEKALRCIRQGLSINPLNYELYFMLGNYHEARNELPKAYLTYENALYHCPKDTTDYQYLSAYFENFKKESNTFVPKVSFIILTWNNLDYTKQCLHSIRTYCNPNAYEIIIADNGSTDGTKEWLSSQSDIITVFNERNLGFAGGCNAGIRMAQEGNDIFLLNNDTVMTQNALYTLRMGLYDNEKIGAAGAITNAAGNNQTIPETFSTLDEYMNYGVSHNIPTENYLEFRTLLIGFALLIKHTAHAVVGDLDEQFFPGNFEDNDYCTRLIMADYNLVLCKNSFVFHYGNKSFALLENNGVHKFSDCYTKNQQRYIDKWHLRPYYSYFCHFELLRQMDRTQHNKSLNILDIGCACGATLLGAKNLFPNASLYGIESDSYSAAFASHIANVVCGNVETIDFPFDVKFDYIFLGDILEHLVHPEELLVKLKKHLTPGGAIITSIPNILHYTAISQILMGSFEYTDFGILDRTHLRFFTKYNSAKLLQNCGYKIIGYDKVLEQPDDSLTDINLLISKLSEIPGVVDKEQFFVCQYIYMATPNS